MTQLNWGELIKDAGDAGTYEPLPVGDYNFKIVEAPYKRAQSGRDMWVVKAEVLEGPYARKLVWNNLVLVTDSPNALAMFFRKMGALGLTQDFFAQSPDVETISRALVGRTFRGQVTQREYLGKINNDIAMYYPLSVAPGAVPPAAAPVAAAAPAPAPAPAVAPAPVASAPVAPPAAPVAAPVAAPAEPGALPAAPF